ncbi:38761_t:CDS:2 [Gigaspora margarita]|uniref:38761_t:CDS:1 n=1 Tax=Gigaspora margarita TaxID=4874 RepID=A0ABN7UNP7_GIGMA|nr:38761_t:CDS:2 [Gigaspora margarita]
MEITIPKGKDRSEELKNFKEEMTKAIKEAEVMLRIREENKKKSEDDSELNQARTVAFQEIEKSMNERGLKVKDLGQYSNYQERINSLGEVEEPKPKREDNYRSLNNPYPPRGQPSYRFPDKSDFPKAEPERIFDRRDEPRELVDEIRREQLNNTSLHKLISVLETRNKELEEDIQALTLKVNTPQVSRIKQAIFGKDKQYEVQVETPPKNNKGN